VRGYLDCNGENIDVVWGGEKRKFQTAVWLKGRELPKMNHLRALQADAALSLNVRGGGKEHLLPISRVRGIVSGLSETCLQEKWEEGGRKKGIFL